MAAVSNMKRKLRRAKREASRALRMVDLALNQRDQARLIAGALEHQMQLREAKEANLTITKVEEPNEESSNDNPTLGA